MRLCYGIILLIILTFLFALSYKSESDLFSPLCVFSILTILRYVPNIISKGYESFTYLNEEDTYYTFCFELLSIFSVLVGYLISISFNMNREKRYVQIEKYTAYKNGKRAVSEWQVMLFYCIGIGARVLLIYKSGGVKYVVANMGTSYAGIREGTGYIFFVSNCAIIAIMLQMYLMFEVRGKNIKIYIHRRNALIAMVVLYCGSYLIYSSRSPVFELMLYLLFGYNYLSRRIKISFIFRPIIMLGLVLAVFIIVAMPIFRNGSSIGKISFGGVVSDFFSEFSYVGRDTFVYQYFSTHEHWFGKNYVSLFTSFIPSTIYKSKPPNDDGIYLLNIMRGNEVVPPTSRDKLIYFYSCPFSTPGIMYANFGIVGLLLGNFFVGWLYAKTYIKAKNSHDIMNIIVYLLVVYSLELSTLSILQTINPLLVSYIVYWIVAQKRKRIKIVISKYKNTLCQFK
jgi:oligosaccharide repeat unit polymerase